MKALFVRDKARKDWRLERELIRRNLFKRGYHSATYSTDTNYHIFELKEHKCQVL